MQTVPFDPLHVPALYEIYGRATSTAAHCRFMPSVAHFGLGLTNPARPNTRLLVAEDAGEARGFAALLDLPPGENSVEETQLTALFVADELAAELLVDECLAQAGPARTFGAFPAEHGRCPVQAYNAGWDGLSDQLSLVARVLARKGFAPVYRELHLEIAGAQFESTVSPCPAGVTIMEQTDTEGYLVVKALVDDQQAGICIYNPLSRVSDHPEAVEWSYIGWLHVAEAHRRRGLARHLLTYSLNRMHERGYRGCWLTTGADNWPAQPLYFSTGFRIVDASSCWLMKRAEY